MAGISIYSRMRACAILFLTFVPVSLAERVIYVDDTATGADNGSSWCGAYRFLQDAIAASAPGDEIRVAQGLYRPAAGPGPRFNINHDLTLRGGFAGCGAADPDERDPARFQAVLSGDLSGNDVPVDTVEDLIDNPSRSENANNIVHMLVGVSCTLDGFTVRGAADSAIASDGDQITIRHCVFEQNGSSDGSLGGAISASGGHWIVENCTLRMNMTGSGGGAISFSSVSSALLENCQIMDNRSFSLGGGVGITGSSASRIVIRSCTISRNFAGSGGGGLYLSSHPLLIEHTLFEQNASGTIGGAIYANSAPLEIESTTISENSAFRGGGLASTESVKIVDSSFLMNAAVFGGAIHHVGFLALNGCLFENNWSEQKGGGIYAVDEDPLSVEQYVVNTFFSGNMAVVVGGGALYVENFSPTINGCVFWQNETFGIGGAIYATGFLADPVVANSTLLQNVAALGGGSIYVARGASAVIQNSILWANEPDQVFGVAGFPVLNYSNVQGGWPGEGNIDVDPLFVSPPSPDPARGTDEVDLRLRPGSPCIDSADNSAVPRDSLDLNGDGDDDEPTPHDADGLPRFVDDEVTADTGSGTPPIVDMGAYEYQATCEDDANCQNGKFCDGN